VGAEESQNATAHLLPRYSLAVHEYCRGALPAFSRPLAGAFACGLSVLAHVCYTGIFHTTSPQRGADRGRELGVQRMKRSLLFLAGVLLTGLLSGCGDETRSDLISATVSTMNEAAGQLDTLTKNVNEAVDKAQKESSNQLDFGSALKTVDLLGKTGKKMQDIKGKLESIRSSITTEEKEENAKNDSGKINETYRRLVKSQTELDTALKRAATVSDKDTRELRDKLGKAIGVYEAMNRQGA
jgi:outer membrane murein-binding lipoprotein Lpp